MEDLEKLRKEIISLKSQVSEIDMKTKSELYQEVQTINVTIESSAKFHYKKK